MSRSFESLSREVAIQFLQTVVVVDDCAYFREDDRVQPHSGLITPGFEQEQSSAAPDGSTLSDSAHELDAKVLIDVFAERGLVCAVLAPKLKEDFEEKVILSAERADIVILDWQLQGKTEPELNAVGIISKILAKERSHHRIRLIAVYSAELPTTILDKIEEMLKENDTFLKEDDYTFIQGATRICVFAKEDTKRADPKRIVKAKDLPIMLITEFTKITMGLLSNAALGSMAAIRKNTHRIIGKFNPSLDAPYLSHRALMAPPAEAESHMSPLIVSEIQSVLDDQNISKYVSKEYIDSWIDNHASSTQLDQRMKISNSKDAKEAILDLIINGIDKEITSEQHEAWSQFLSPLKSETDGTNLSQLTDILTKDGSSGDAWDREFAYLMSMCSHYDNPVPMLSLGSILADGSGGNISYYLCVQPLCDSVRLSKKRMFPFLRMIKAADSDASDFGFIIRELDGKLIALRLSLRPHESKMFEFKPGSGQDVILASKEGDLWIFNTFGEDARKLRWIAELKSAHAQRVSNDYAREISRVGLNESEWLRRQALNKKKKE